MNCGRYFEYIWIFLVSALLDATRVPHLKQRQWIKYPLPVLGCDIGESLCTHNNLILIKPLTNPGFINKPQEVVMAQLSSQSKIRKC